MDAKQLMHDTRARLIMSRPFFGFPSMNLRLVEGDCPTAQTNGVVLMYNPSFIKELPDTQRQTVIAHEAAHCMLGHVFRRQGRDPEVWNQACDFVVNEHLRNNGFSVPNDWLYDYQYHGMSAEQVYEILYSKPEGQRPDQKPDDVQDCPGDAGQGDGQDEGDQQGSQGGDQKGGDQKGQEGDGGQPLTPGEVEAKWKVSVVQASHLAEVAGKEAAGMDTFVEAAKEPYIDWRSVLREFVATAIPSDYRMFPANRRHLYRGMYLPSIAKRPYPKLLVAIDTSGSVSERLLAQFVAELNAIMDEMKCLIHVLACDTEVDHVGSFDDEPIGDITARGRGGTSFAPPFGWADENAPDIDGLIYLTDGVASFPPISHYKTLWAISSRVQAPWGETLSMPTM